MSAPYLSKMTQEEKDKLSSFPSIPTYTQNEKEHNNITPADKGAREVKAFQMRDPWSPAEGDFSPVRMSQGPLRDESQLIPIKPVEGFEVLRDADPKAATPPTPTHPSTPI